MKKRIIIIVLLVLLFLIVSFVYSFIENREKIVFLGDYTKVYLNKDGIKVKNDNYKVDNKKVKIFFENVYLDVYLSSVDMNVNQIYYLYDDKGNRYNMAPDLIATTRNLKLNIKTPVESIITNSELESLIEELDIKKDSIDMPKLKKYDFDFDGDKKNETIYYISYNLSESNFNNLFVVKSDDNYEVFDSFEVDRIIPASKQKSIFKYIDFDSDGTYELVLTTNNGEDVPSKFEVYSYSDGSFEIIE